MSYRVDGDSAQNLSVSGSGNANPVTIMPASDRSSAALKRILEAVDAGKFERALELLKAARGGLEVQNTKGVCLLRLGRFEEAILLYRALTLDETGVGIRKEVPTSYKINFATALLLGGHVAGCRQILDEIHDEQNPEVRRLRAAIKQWEQSLSFWQELDWRIGKAEPNNRPVKCDFTPGVLDTQLS